MTLDFEEEYYQAKRRSVNYGSEYGREAHYYDSQAPYGYPHHAHTQPNLYHTNGTHIDMSMAYTQQGYGSHYTVSESRYTASDFPSNERNHYPPNTTNTNF